MKHTNLAVVPRIVYVILLAIQSASSQSCTQNTFSKTCTCTSDQLRLALKCNYTSNTDIERLLPGNQSLSTLQKVDLSSNNLSSLPQDYFQGISVISTIDLSINNFRDIPSVIFKLNNISRLDISKNKLQHLTLSVLSKISENGTLVVSENNIQEISEPTYGITVGKHLYLIEISHNALTVINDTSSFWNSCVKLDLSYNKLATFHPKIISYTQILVLSFNSLKELYADSFKSFVNLKHLNLSHTQIHKINETTFHPLTGLIYLDLSHNELGSLHPGSFSHSPRLEVLDISNNVLMSLDSESFRGLDYSLIEINLSNNNLYIIEMKSFSNLQELRVITLSNNQDLTKVNFDLPSHLKKMDLSNSSLQEINECKFIQLLDIELLNIENNALKCSCHLSWLYSKYEIVRKSNSPTSEIFSPISPWKCIDSEGNRRPIGNFESGNCHDHNTTPEHCTTTFNMFSVENRNFSIGVTKIEDYIVVKWTFNGSMDIYGFLVVLKKIDSSDIMLTSPVIHNNVREYTLYQISEDSATICVQVIGNSTAILMEKCDNIITLDMKMIIGLLAGSIFLVPAIIVFGCIACKDKKAMAELQYQLLQEANVEKDGQKTAERIDVVQEPETTTSSSNGRQSTGPLTATSSMKETECVVQAKLSFSYENKSYMSEIGGEESNDIERNIDIMLVNNDTMLHTEIGHGDSDECSSKL